MFNPKVLAWGVRSGVMTVVILGALHVQAAVLPLYSDVSGEGVGMRAGLLDGPISAVSGHWVGRTDSGRLVSLVLHVSRGVVVGDATLDGMVEGTSAVFEAKFMLPWSFSEEAAAEKHMAQLQHNMWVTNATAAVLSIITGGGKWVEIKIPADSLYQHLLLTAEKKFWRCVESGERPRLFGVEPPRTRIEAVRIVDMSVSNAWAELSSVFRRTREAHLEHENAKTELKGLMPEDAKEAIGHGIRARRSKSGAVSFDVLSEGGSHAPLQ